MTRARIGKYIGMIILKAFIGGVFVSIVKILNQAPIGGFINGAALVFVLVFSYLDKTLFKEK